MPCISLGEDSKVITLLSNEPGWGTASTHFLTHWNIFNATVTFYVISQAKYEQGVTAVTSTSRLLCFSFLIMMTASYTLFVEFPFSISNNCSKAG